MGKEGCVQLQALFCAQLSNQLHVADKDFTFLREIRDVITQRMLFGGFQVPQEQNCVLGHPVMGQQDGSRYLSVQLHPTAYTWFPLVVVKAGGMAVISQPHSGLEREDPVISCMITQKKIGWIFSSKTSQTPSFLPRP